MDTAALPSVDLSSSLLVNRFGGLEIAFSPGNLERSCALLLLPCLLSGSFWELTYHALTATTIHQLLSIRATLTASFLLPNHYYISLPSSSLYALGPNIYDDLSFFLSIIE